MKKEIRIYMVHSFVTDEDSLYKILHIHEPENQRYKFIYDSISPDYLIASEQIYYNEEAWEKFLELYFKSKIHIWYSGECIFPDLNIFDYATCFDRNFEYSERICRIPIRLFYESIIFDKENVLVGDEQATRIELSKKEEFCNFIYSNGKGHWARKKIFEKMNEYKKVNSLGNYLNNSQSNKINNTGDWPSIIKESISIKRKYKFSIACENAIYEGYTSEKLFSSLEAHTIPIYWGNPLVEKEVNEKAFINCHNYKDFDEVLKRVKEIDQNDELWIQMISEPWLTQNHISREKVEISRYYRFLDNIFMQSIESACRKGWGYHPDNYKKIFFESNVIRWKIKH